MNNKKKILELAKRRARKIQKLKKDPRYLKVMGRLVREKLIDAQIRPSPRKFTSQEALWVGENIEPRVLELLPAIAIKRPALFLTHEYPKDLHEVVNHLKRGETGLEFRGIPLKKCESWIPHVGRKGEYPSAVKNFRMHKEELKILDTLSEKLKTSEAEIIRQALIHYSKKVA